MCFLAFCKKKLGFTLISLLLLRKRSCKGFTLIELLVVIAILAVLSVIGFAVFRGLTASARDSRRKADIDALAKAYEIRKDSTGYLALVNDNFSTGKKPEDPDSAKGQYFNWLASDKSGFKVCASLEANSNNVCNTPALNCYCKLSSQGAINTSSAPDTTNSTQYFVGYGGSSSASPCDPNGTLFAGLVGYWKMDNNANDSVGSNNGTWVGTGAYVAGVPTNPQFNNAGNFNGINNYVVTGVNSIFSIQTAGTVSFWARPTSALGGLHAVLAKRGPDWVNLDYIVFWYNQKFYGSIANGATSLSYSGPSTAVLPLDDWYLITFTWNTASQTASIYLNENLAQSVNTVIVPTTNNSSVTIGRDNLYNDYYFTGQLDDIRIYNRALSGGFSGSEISNLYNSGNGCIY